MTGHGRMTSTEAAAREFQDRAILWSAGEIRAPDVVAAACDALVAGLDSPALRILAACTRAEADYDVPDLLPPALDELGLTSYPLGSTAGREAAVRALAARMLADELTPSELTFRIHRRFGHTLPLAARLAELDEEYGQAGHDRLPEGAVTEQRQAAHETAEDDRLEGVGGEQQQPELALLAHGGADLPDLVVGPARRAAPRLLDLRLLRGRPDRAAPHRPFVRRCAGAPQEASRTLLG